MDNQDRANEIVEELKNLKQMMILNTEKYDVTPETPYMETMIDSIKQRNDIICKDIDAAIKIMEMVEKRISVYNSDCKKFGR